MGDPCWRGNAPGLQHDSPPGFNGLEPENWHDDIPGAMAQFQITREDGPARGRYVARLGGIDAEAELTYRHAGPNIIIADHTEVPDAFRGQGAGRLLVTRLVEDARAQGAKIRARCTYVEAERRKHPEWADAFEG